MGDFRAMLRFNSWFNRLLKPFGLVFFSSMDRTADGIKWRLFGGIKRRPRFTEKQIEGLRQRETKEHP